MDRPLNCYLMGGDKRASDLLGNFISSSPGLNLVGSCANVPPVFTLDVSVETLADVVFVDLDRSGAAGMLLGYPLRFDCVVFYGTSRNLAAEVFDLEAVDYLLMPCTYERFLKGIDRVKAKLGKNILLPCVSSPCFFIQTEVKGKFVRINKQEIVYAEGALNYIQIHLEGKSYSAYLTIKEMEDTLCSPQFIRVHRSFIINMDKVTGMEGNTVFLSGNTRVVLGPSYRDGFFERLNALLVRSKRLG